MNDNKYEAKYGKKVFLYEKIQLDKKFYNLQ